MKAYTNQSDNLVPRLLATGAAAQPVAAPNTLNGYTLTTGTWYVELSSSEGPLTEAWIAAVSASFGATLAATWTLQSTCYPATVQGTGQGTDTLSYVAATNRWFPESPIAASVLTAGGAGNAYAAPTFTAGGSTIGGFLTYIPQAGARRYRLEITVTVAGTMRVGYCGKD